MAIGVARAQRARHGIGGVACVPQTNNSTCRGDGLEPDRAGRYPIHYQALEGSIEELERSLAEGVDPNVSTLPD